MNSELMSSQLLLRLQDVVKGYQRRGGFNRCGDKKPRVLDGLSMEILEGEILGIVGLSGSGKSTLARILAFMEPPDEGEVFFRGESLTPTRISPSVRCKIQYVFQNPASSLNPRMTAWRQLCEAPIYHKMKNPAETSHAVAEMVPLLGLDVASLHRYPHEFSGGQQQRLALARALSVEPNLLICDEVTSALDPATGDELISLLLRINAELGVTIVFVSHSLRAVSRLCHRSYLLKDGKLHPHQV